MKSIGPPVRNALLLLCFTVIGCGDDQSRDPGPSAQLSADRFSRVAADRLLVAFKSQHIPSPIDETHHEDTEKLLNHRIRKLFASHDGVRSIHYLASLPLIQRGQEPYHADSEQPLSFGWKPPWKSRLFKRSVASVAAVVFRNRQSALSLTKEWYERGLIYYAEADRFNQLQDESGSSIFMKKETRHWWLEQINARESWSALDLSSSGSVEPPRNRRPVVAVLDSGVDFNHPSLKGQMWNNRRKADTGVCPGDKHGCNTVNPLEGTLGEGASVYPLGLVGPGKPCDQRNSYLRGSCGHGTHVSGLIAGRRDGTVPGICPMCRVMSLRVAELDQKRVVVSDSSVLRALQYIARQPSETDDGRNLVRVVNSSFGKFEHSRTLNLMMQKLAYHRDGILIVAAAGNENSQRRVYPAASDYSIAVAALDHRGRKASYSNFGSWVDISAPGGTQSSDDMEKEVRTLLAADPGGGFSSVLGTSMAAPMVSGVAGLVLAADPDIPLEELRSRILRSANPVIYRSDHASGFNYRYFYPEVDGRHRPLLGQGQLDASAAVYGARQNWDDEHEDRLTPICGGITVGNGTRLMNYAIIFLLYLFPFAFALYRWLASTGGSFYGVDGEKNNA